ncbi:unnamed protein product [Acanthoscelides obtectus]|uniref:Uncharacterized protein n=1 Tax=Acanthoscelides obtectus TaxID=200917 RepID=A0A9P0KNZ0_ACAOB|nr:unnamed protein product [Acanthoscelides obtectus]CAK1665240.1 Histone chaperone ASF1A [Acanthoscelides obtectus]
MAKVQLCNITVMDNPSPFLNPFQFEITFECIEELKEDLEWKMIYVGSAESEEYDQVLESVFVGPIPEGKHMFVFQVMRNILASEPRVTRFKINWEETTPQEPMVPVSEQNGSSASTSALGPPGVSADCDSTTGTTSTAAATASSTTTVDMPAFNENSNSWATMECS